MEFLLKYCISFYKAHTGDCGGTADDEDDNQSVESVMIVCRGKSILGVGFKEEEQHRCLEQFEICY